MRTGSVYRGPVAELFGVMLYIFCCGGSLTSGCESGGGGEHSSNDEHSSMTNGASANATNGHTSSSGTTADGRTASSGAVQASASSSSASGLRQRGGAAASGGSGLGHAQAGADVDDSKRFSKKHEETSFLNLSFFQRVLTAESRGFGMGREVHSWGYVPFSPVCWLVGKVLGSPESSKAPPVRSGMAPSLFRVLLQVLLYWALVAGVYAAGKSVLVIKLGCPAWAWSAAFGYLALRLL